jgi:S-adenosylmethionine synthetase
MVLVAGEITSKAIVNYQHVIRNTIKSIGYDDSSKGFDYKTCSILVAIDEQSADIAQALHLNELVDRLAAGDQGQMFGYATDETDECMPLTILLAHGLNKRLSDCRHSGELTWARPDSKTQVTVEYKLVDGACVPVRIHNIVISVQHSADVTIERIRRDLMDIVIKPVVPVRYLDDHTMYYLNPSGVFLTGGPQADAGLTGRKIIVDTYGGWGAHGGGAFSGKDPSKVDRSGAYAARWIAKSLVKAGLCKRVLIQVFSFALVESNLFM